MMKKVEVSMEITKVSKIIVDVPEHFSIDERLEYAENIAREMISDEEKGNNILFSCHDLSSNTFTDWFK